MCHAITNSGKRCKVKSSNYFCHIHTPYIEPSLDKKREDILLKICFCFDPSYFNIYQREAWPLFKDIDLTSEILGIIKRGKDIGNWTEETYDSVISTYFNDGVNDCIKYHIIKDTICKHITLRGKDFLTSIKIFEIYRDLNLLLLKFSLSLGRYTQLCNDVVSFYKQALLEREKLINKYREKQLNILRLKEAKKYTPLCDDVCNYIIGKYL